MFLPSVSFLAFFKSWNRDSMNWRKTWHLTGCFFVKPVWVRAFLYLAFCKYIFTQTEIIISHVRHGGKFPFSAGAAGIKIILLNGTGLLEANCGPRIKLCWHPNMRDMRSQLIKYLGKLVWWLQYLEINTHNNLPSDVGLENHCSSKNRGVLQQDP